MKNEKCLKYLKSFNKYSINSGSPINTALLKSLNYFQLNHHIIIYTVINLG